MPIQYNSNGIITQNITEILDERENNLRTIMGEEFVIDKTTPIGNMELADANSELTIQELIAWLIPNQLDANTATGHFLDVICEKNRIYRRQPSFTTLDLIINGDPNTSFIKGDITVSDSITGVYYDLNEDCTIPEEGKVKARFICESYGNNSPVAQSNIEIQTPLSGLESVSLDIDNVNISLGRYTETDDELRNRRRDSVAQTSTSTLASIRGNIYSIDGVEHVTYFENDTESTDSNGLPMKSFEFIVDGGDENKIADAIFNNKPCGTRAYGTTNIVKKDSESQVHNIGFTKAKNINIGIIIRLETNVPQTSIWANNVLKALKEQFDSIQGIGTNVKDYNYYTVLTQFPEVSDIFSIMFYDTESETQPPTQYSNYQIGSKEIAKLDIKNISILGKE